MNKNIIWKVCLSLVLMLISSLSAFSQKQLWVGESYTFDVTSDVLGLTANLSWSTNGGYLSLSGSGFYRDITVTKYFSGTATVTCEWDYKLTGNDRYTHMRRDITISCRDNKVSISPTSMTLSSGESRYVSYSHQYDNQYTNAANAYFQSTNTSVCTVSSTGKVIAKNPGTAYINVYSNISSVSPYCLVTVKPVDPTSVTLPTSLSITAGEQKKLTPTLYPSNAQTSYSWTSSDTNIASVSSDGTITAKKHGNATISVKTSNGLTASCYLTVAKPRIEINMSLQGGLYQSGQILHLNTNCPDALIYYTIDGTAPSRNSLLYSDSIILTKPISLRAVAFHEDYIDSDVISAQFNVTSLLILNTTPNARNGMSSISYPTICFSEILNSTIDKTKIHFEFNGALSEFNAYVSNDKLIIEPLDEEYYNGGYVNILIDEYSVSSVSNQPNCAISINAYVNSSNDVYQFYPVKVYAGWFASAYICNNGDLNTFGGWPRESWGSYSYFEQHSFHNVINSCNSANIFPFVDINSNLWIAGCNQYFFPFQQQPIIYKSGIKECAYANDDTLFYVTQEDKLYGVGSDLFKQLLGKGNKKHSWTSGDIVYYADTPVHLMDNVKHVYAADRNCAVLMNDGSLLMWGEYNWGKHKNLSTSYKVADNVIQASIGISEPVTYVKEDGTAWYVDENLQNHKISDNIKYIFGARDRGYYITLDGKLYGWGRNDHGQLGDGTVVDYGPYLKPNQAVFIMDDIIDVSCSWDYTLALTSNYEIYGWGQNQCKRFYRDKLTSFNQTTPMLVFSPIKNPLIQNITVPTEYTAYINEEAAIPISIEPSNGTCKSYEWTSSDTSVATVTKNGIISPQYEGECILTLKVIGYDDSILSKTIRLKVLPELQNGISPVSITDNENIMIFNLQGFLIYSGLAKNVSFLPHGIYILVSAKGSTKIFR